MAAELEGLVQHFHFKTGRSLCLPHERPSPDLVKVDSNAVGRMGESTVVNVLLKAMGLA